MANAVAFELAGSAESAERNRFVMWCEVTSLRVLSEPKVEDSGLEWGSPTSTHIEVFAELCRA